MFQARRRRTLVPTIDTSNSSDALVQLTALLKGPAGPDDEATLSPDGQRVRFRISGVEAPLSGGILDLLSRSFQPTFTQRLLDSRPSAWLYDRVRDRLAVPMGLPRFAEEVARVEQRLALAPGDAVLDVACGHGNFTVEIARRVSPGLVVGLDIARSMLDRAADRIRRAGLRNAALLRADALALPFVDASFARVNCAGGLHQLPDLERAVRELARVVSPGGRVALSGFARPGDPRAGGVRERLGRSPGLHVVSLEALSETLGRNGFEEIGAEMSGATMGYAWARRSGGP
jgi:SAM-dependent methyltransferase